MAPNTLGHLSENDEDLLKSCEERNYMGMHVWGRLRGHGNEGIRGVRNTKHSIMFSIIQ